MNEPFQSNLLVCAISENEMSCLRYGEDAGKESLSRSSKYGCFKAALAEIRTAGS